MTRKSPNKRKSLAAATPGAATPKKQKLDTPTLKTGPDTPKNNPKTPKMENKSPKNTPKSMKKGTPFGKTWKSAKKGNKIENGVSAEEKRPQVAAKPNLVTKTPKSAKKQKNKQMTPKPVTPKVDNDISEGSDEDVDMVSVQKTPKSTKKPNAKTPKSNKKSKEVEEDGSSEGESDTEKSSPKMKKFEGTKTLDVKSLSEIDPEIMKNLSRNQKRKLIKKLKRKAKLSEAQKTGQNKTNVAQKSIKEFSETNSPKKTKRSNKKADSILQKNTELNTPGEKKSPGKNKKKNKNKGTPKKNTESAKVSQKSEKAPESSSDESDYEVESEIRPEKISKSLNEGIIDDNEFIIGNKKKQKNKPDPSPFSSSSEEEDDHDEGIEPVKENDSEENASLQISKNEKNQKSGVKTNKKPKLSATIDLKDLNKGGIMKKGQTRYVLFVNNIPYTATKTQIQEHFAKVCTLKDVRIPIDKKSNKPKGFCYVELSTEADYQKGFSVHHTFMNGRRINVLYTSPGQKNSDKKKKEIKKKNMKLQGMRKNGMLKGVPSDTQKRSARRAKKRFFDKQLAEKYGSNQV